MKIQCLVCNQKSEVKPQRRGNTAIEVILWCFCLVPGVIYSLWRNGENVYICPICKSKSITIIDQREIQKIKSQQKQIKQKKIHKSFSLTPVLKARQNTVVLGFLSVIFFFMSMGNKAFLLVSAPCFVFCLINYFLIYRPAKKKITLKNEKSRSYKAILYTLIGILPVIFISSFVINFVKERNRFELSVSRGHYQRISNNRIETRQKTFDLNLSTKGVKSLTINNQLIEPLNKISYPITLTDDKTLQIEAKNRKSETKKINLKINFLTETEIAQRKKKAQENAQIRKEKAAAKEKALTDKENADIKKNIVTTIQTYNEGLAPWEDWRLVEIIKKGRSSEDPEIQNLSDQLQKLAENFQAKEFPEKRVAYAEELGDKLWEDDYEIKISGTAKDILTVIHWSFANNRVKKDFHNLLREKFYELRFSQIRYRWYDGSSEYTYYNLETLLDRKIEGLD